MTMSVRDRQVGGTHYKEKSIQPWDIIEEYGLNFWTGNAIKYICRDKNDRIEDLRKAGHYLEYEIERLAKGRHPTVAVCSECQAMLEDADVFCPDCGTQVRPLAQQTHPTYYPL